MSDKVSWTKSLQIALVSPSRKHEKNIGIKSRGLCTAADLSSAMKERALSSPLDSARSGGLKGCQFHGSEPCENSPTFKTLWKLVDKERKIYNYVQKLLLLHRPNSKPSSPGLCARELGHE